ncbi:MAG: S8 family serine peptidase [Anaerolineae bacterium]|nr:S8 family serine peptidase [Anaerolineae bacterium]
MSSSSEKSQTIPNCQLPVPPFGQLLLFLLTLGWLVLAPILVGVLAIMLPAAWPALATDLVAVILLAGFLLIPLAGFFLLAYRRDWPGLRPFALALLITGLYIAGDALLRAGAKSPDPLYNLSPLSDTVLRLMGLTGVALGLGGFGLLKAGIPRSLPILSHAFGFDHPPLAGLLVALAALALVTIGWPLTGALGDNWASLLILIHALAVTLPDEIFFRGAVLGAITFNFQHRKALAALAALLIYMAFTPSLIVPGNDWAKLVLLITAIPFAVITTELRALTGSIWAGILFAWVYRAAPLLFTDSRVELPLITQPWQTAAYLGMMIGTGILAILLWAGRQFLMPRWHWSRLATTIITLVVTLFFWGLWAGLWGLFGYPGFHNDGFLIIMTEQADLRSAENIDDPVARRALVHDRLIETAAQTQAPVRAALTAAGLDYRPFYLINMIRVEGHHRRMDEFANLPGVARVMLNPNVRPYPFRDLNIGYGVSTNQGQGVEWNISQTRADEVWSMGYTGQGIVVGGQDTGYDWQHPALRPAYRGENSQGEVDHNYNWHDAWSEGVAPFDNDGHGTHTMGITLGNDGQGNQIGMAPDVQWIGCRNMRRGLGNPASYTECMEFFLAPYPLGGDPFTDGDVSFSPHVINNSWGCPDIEGCDDEVLAPALAALRAAGLMMVVSAGNDGPGCQTVMEPPARYDSVFSVGATNNSGEITAFSSRGPVPTDPPLLKPDIAAPGSYVRSSIPGGKYALAPGTSMAGPHVTGLVALLWSANPHLIGRIDETEEIIRQSARPVEVSAACDIQDNRSLEELSLMEQIRALEEENSSVCACGDAVGVPNNVYGWGEIDALAALELALEYSNTAE